MLIMGTVGVANPVGRLQVGQISIANDSYIPGLKRLTDAVHAHDGRVCAQLNHGGMTSIYDMAAGAPGADAIHAADGRPTQRAQPR